MRDIRNLFISENEEGDYCKSVRECIFWNNNYIEYQSNDDRNKTLSVEEYLNKTKTYLNDCVRNLKKIDMRKV